MAATPESSAARRGDSPGGPETGRAHAGERAPGRKDGHRVPGLEVEDEEHGHGGPDPEDEQGRGSPAPEGEQESRQPGERDPAKRHPAPRCALQEGLDIRDVRIPGGGRRDEDHLPGELPHEGGRLAGRVPDRLARPEPFRLLRGDRATLGGPGNPAVQLVMEVGKVSRGPRVVDGHEHEQGWIGGAEPASLGPMTLVEDLAGAHRGLPLPTAQAAESGAGEQGQHPECGGEGHGPERRPPPLPVDEEPGDHPDRERRNGRSQGEGQPEGRPGQEGGAEASRIAEHEARDGCEPEKPDREVRLQDRGVDDPGLGDRQREGGDPRRRPAPRAPGDGVDEDDPHPGQEDLEPPDDGR